MAVVNGQNGRKENDRRVRKKEKLEIIRFLHKSQQIYKGPGLALESGRLEFTELDSNKGAIQERSKANCLELTTEIRNTVMNDNERRPVLLEF